MELVAFRHFNITSFLEFERMTLREFDVLMKAAKLKKLDKEYFIHLQAFKNQQIQMTKNKGKKPFYKDFNDFFPYQKYEKEILSDGNNKSGPDKKLMELLKKANS